MRGQISIDILLAVAIGLTAAGTLMVVGNEMVEMQKEAGVRQQLHNIGTGVAEVISTSAVLSDTDALPGSSVVEFDIPELLVLGETKPEPCQISIDAATATITLSYKIFDLETGDETVISIDKPYVEPANLLVPVSAECGQRLIITKS